MSRWTLAQVEKLAPDQKSVTAARKLARPGPWSDTGSTDTLVFGKCQGSGSTAYQVSVDLTGPAFKCSCPSRKFPCKHGVALLMLWVDGDGSIADVEQAAEFASDWATGRANRATAEAEKEDTPPDPEAQRKRLERRLELMSDGLADLELVLADLVRAGLAQARQRPYSFWDEIAARLVDAQVPGLAERIRSAPSLLHGRDDWADALLAETGRWYLAARAWRGRDDLSESDMGNLRAFLGWNTPTDDVRATPTVNDEWQIVGVHRTDDGRLQAQRTWIHGKATGETALVLDFAAAGGALGTSHVVGTVVSTPVAFYPGSGVRRALFAEPPIVSGQAATLPSTSTVAHALDQRAVHLAQNPFTDRVPVLLAGWIRPAPVGAAPGSSATLVDAEGQQLPLTTDTNVPALLACTGGHSVHCFGELEAEALRVTTTIVDGTLVPV